LFSPDSGSGHWRPEIPAESGKIPEFQVFPGIYPEFRVKKTGNSGSGPEKVNHPLSFSLLKNL
jgi:hypothetical protein